MANAKKLPSGNWRVNAYICTDDNGKKIYKSFTASTKKEAEYMASVYKMEENERKTKEKSDDISVDEAFSRYIESKSNVLSPSTVRDYTRIRKKEIAVSCLSKKFLSEVTPELVQKAVNQYSLNHSPKSVRNFHGLISAVLRVYKPELRLNTTLPQREKKELYVPTDEDIKKLIAAARGTEMEKAIMLAAFGGLRRGEICALTADDIDGDVITVNKAMVMNVDHVNVIKSPKTYSGYRSLELPHSVIEKLPKTGRIVNMTPNAITKAIAKLQEKLSIPSFRFHDLRHYQASVLHAMGVPDKYIIARGGWRTESTLKNIYQHTMDKKRQEVETQICCSFSQLIQEVEISKIQHKRQHKVKKDA